eukprot:3139748-Pleurochrysis_carterae.AAC.1
MDSHVCFVSSSVDASVDLSLWPAQSGHPEEDAAAALRALVQLAASAQQRVTVLLLDERPRDSRRETSSRRRRRVAAPPRLPPNVSVRVLPLPPQTFAVSVFGALATPAVAARGHAVLGWLTLASAHASTRCTAVHFVDGVGPAALAMIAQQQGLALRGTALALH